MHVSMESCLIYLKEKVTVADGRLHAVPTHLPPSWALVGISCFLWKTKIHTGIFCWMGEVMDRSVRTEAVCLNLTFIAANEGWKALIGLGSGGGSYFVPEEGAVSGEAGPVQQLK